MLAQNLRSAAELSIPEGWRDALIAVLFALEREELTHWKVGGLFDMSCHMRRTKCGTAGCIAYHAQRLGKGDFWELTSAWPTDFTRLFFPVIDGHLENIRPEQAIVALRGYLRDGVTQWGAKK